MKPSGQILTALADTAALGAHTAPMAATEQVAASLGDRTRTRRSSKIGQANFAIKFKGETLIAPSPGGLASGRSGSPSRTPKTVGASRREAHETYELTAGKARAARDRHAGMAVEFLETKGTGRRPKALTHTPENGFAIRSAEARFDFVAHRMKAGSMDMRS